MGGWNPICEKRNPYLLYFFNWQKQFQISQDKLVITDCVCGNVSPPAGAADICRLDPIVLEFKQRFAFHTNNGIFFLLIKQRVWDLTCHRSACSFGLTIRLILLLNREEFQFLKRLLIPPHVVVSIPTGSSGGHVRLIPNLVCIVKHIAPGHPGAQRR